MKAALLIFVFALLVTSWLTDAGPPRGVPIGVSTIVETPTGTDIKDTDAIGDFFMTGESRDTKIMTSVRSTGSRMGDMPRLGVE